jgi:Xaa-Pro aminopeptidase
LAPRFKFAAFCKLKRFRSIREGHAYLRDHPDACMKFGFKKLPTYELLREFLNERLPRILGILNDEVLVEADKELQEHAEQRLFEEVSQDAVDLKARKTDEEAGWSEYYKEYGYKADLVVGLGTGMIGTPVFLGSMSTRGSASPSRLRD